MVKVRVDENVTEKVHEDILMQGHGDDTKMLDGQVMWLNWRHEAMNQLKWRERGRHDRKCKQIQSSLLKMLENITGSKNLEINNYVWSF